MFLQPYIGHVSDRTHTRFGRRMPFLLGGIPIAAVFFALIPFHNGLLTLILFMVCMNLSMAIFRSPTIALMPDITPEYDRAKANGIINFMGGFGAILAFSIGSYLFKTNEELPFLVVAVIFLFALWIIYKNINEKRDGIANTSHTNIPVIPSSIPCGHFGAKFGMKKMIIIGIVGLIVIFLLLYLIKIVFALRVILLIGGMFWACININAYPFIVSTGSGKSYGTRTGMYYLVSSLRELRNGREHALQ